MLVGLGNPGAKYAQNRHNIGFMAVDQVARDQGFSPWRSKFNGLVSEGRIGGNKVLLLKPHTFMNRSGQAVGEAMRYHKLDPSDVIVFHDELDLAPGKLRAKIGGGHAGHNGLRSIDQDIGQSYGRVRLGIGHPGQKDRVSGYVLSDFSKSEQDWLDTILQGISDSIDMLVQGDAAGFVAKVSNATARKIPATAATKPPAAPIKIKKGPPSESDDRSPLQKLMDKFR